MPIMGSAVGTRRATRRDALSVLGGAIAAPFVLRNAHAAEAVNVGVVLPLSGANAQFGINSRNGIELVADQINKAGGIKALGGATIELVVADATSTPTTAATVAQRLVTQNRVTAILGAFVSSLTIAISEVTERRDIPLLTMSFADQITGRGFKNIFQVVAKASVIGAAQFENTLAIAQAAGTKLERIAIMYEDTAYGTSQAVGLRNGAKKHDVQIVMDDAYPLGITDVTPLINKLRASGAQAVFPVSYLNDSLQIIRVMRQQGISIPAIGGAAGYVIPDFEKGLGEHAEGILSIDTSNYDLAPEPAKAFR
ncbi:MAG TPA: ABC transporter substrate-binding protein, partial [Burkholderiales bacterium]|nr:ABC transporter substrate-binding protein [Burkholderiales bacterium]